MTSRSVMRAGSTPPGPAGSAARALVAGGVLGLAAAVGIAAAARAAEGTEASPTLRFARGGETTAELDAEALAGACGAEQVSVQDPYYGRQKHYRAVPLRCALERGLGTALSGLEGRTLFFEARDGYQRPAEPAQVAEPGGWLAFADADLPAGRWEPIDRGQKDPSPFYVVWTGEAQRDPERHPWPYALARVRVASFEDAYPHTVPRGVDEGDPAWRGWTLFRRHCFACHAINGEGGTVGPELNVPQSIVEYRPAEKIRAYVRDPATFRYTSMPAHPGLDDADLDALIAYFEAMSRRKHDPRASAAGG